MTYFDQEKNEHYIPYVIEPSLGVETRVSWPSWCDAYDEEVVGQDKKGNDDIRVVLHLHPALAPFKAAVLPLCEEALPGKAEEIYHDAPEGLHGRLSTMPAPSASAIAGKTRSARPTASPSILKPLATRRRASRRTTP